MTDAERVAKVPWQRRLQIHAMRKRGQYLTHIAAQLGLSKPTVAAVIEAMVKREEQMKRQKHAPCPKERWHTAITPGWRVHDAPRKPVEGGRAADASHNPIDRPSSDTVA